MAKFNLGSSDLPTFGGTGGVSLANLGTFMPATSVPNPNAGFARVGRGTVPQPAMTNTPASFAPTMKKTVTTETPIASAPQQPQATQGFSNPNATTFVGDPNAPQPKQLTGFDVPPQSGPYTSTQMNGDTTFKDLFAKRQQYEDKYIQAYDDYARAESERKQGELKTIADDQYARYYSGASSAENAMGLTGLMSSQNTIQNAGRNIAAQGALLRSQGIGNLLGYNQQDIANQFTVQQNIRANANEFSNFTTNPQGDVYGTVRDPRTGATSIQAFGNIYNGTFNQANPQPAGGTQGQGALTQLGNGMFQTPDGGTVNQTYAQKISSLPAQYQQFVNAGPEGVAYINSSRLSQLPSGAQQDIQRKAAAAGIPWLDETQSAGLQSVYGLYDTLGLMESLIDETLSSGVVGKAKGGIKARMQDIFGIYPQLQNFGNLRTLAGQADTNLMGGIGSGFRQNTANLGLSVQNLPTASDNLETAKVKIAATRALLDQSMLKTFPIFEGSGSLTSGGAGKQTAPSVVETKVGPVDNSWFN